MLLLWECKRILVGGKEANHLTFPWDNYFNETFPQEGTTVLSSKHWKGKHISMWLIWACVKVVSFTENSDEFDCDKWLKNFPSLVLLNFNYFIMVILP